MLGFSLFTWQSAGWPRTGKVLAGEGRLGQAASQALADAKLGESVVPALLRKCRETSLVPRRVLRSRVVVVITQLIGDNGPN
jgi:hypothetical protein